MAKTEEQLAAEKAAQQKAEKDAKLKALQAAMSKIEKDFGKGSIMRMGDENIEAVDVISTGSIGLDVALGVGGYPRGRIIEIYGPESSGKTTLAIHAIAEAQKKGGIAAFIDAEHAFDRFYAEKLGVESTTFGFRSPTTVSRPCKSPTSSSVHRLSTSWWSTLWLPLHRKRRLRAAWATR